MNKKQVNIIPGRTGAGTVFKKACVTSCQKILAQIRDAKAAMLDESCGALGVREQMLRLALNEAEALAWQTVFPHLIFPTLAAEKIQGVAAWNQHQRLLDERVPVFPFKN